MLDIRAHAQKVKGIFLDLLEVARERSEANVTSMIDRNLCVAGAVSCRRYYIDSFLKRHAQLLAGRVVLDVGGKTQERRGYFDPSPHARRLIVVNLRGPADVHADGCRLPVRSASVDAVLCTEVLEHLANPASCIGEMHRVLKPGGVALLTVPFLYAIHPDPGDYGRYTPQFWSESLGATGFAVSGLEAQGGLRSVVIDLIRSATYTAARRRSLGDRLRRRALVTFLRLATGWAIAQDGDPSIVTTGYGIVAVRPGSCT